MHTRNHLKIIRRSLALAMMAGLVPAMAATHNATTVDGISISGYIDPTYIYNQDAQVSSFFLGLQAFVWVRGSWACIRRPRRQVLHPYA